MRNIYVIYNFKQYVLLHTCIDTSWNRGTEMDFIKVDWDIWQYLFFSSNFNWKTSQCVLKWLYYAHFQTSFESLVPLVLPRSQNKSKRVSLFQNNPEVLRSFSAVLWLAEFLEACQRPRPMAYEHVQQPFLIRDACFRHMEELETLHLQHFPSVTQTLRTCLSQNLEIQILWSCNITDYK